MIATYRVTRSHSERVEGLLFKIVEVEFKKRRHQRIIGADPKSRETFGKTLIYADSYSGAEETTYLYARHLTDSKNFFPELNTFFQSLLSDGYGELSHIPFPVIFNIEGNPIQDKRIVPLNPSRRELKKTRFFRMDLPFGAMSIEFGNKVTSDYNELDLTESGELIRALDGPLIGCDFSLGSTYIPIFTKFHWARKYLGPSLLQALSEQLMGSEAYA